MNVDCSWQYPRAFYEASQGQPHPAELKSHIEIVEHRLGTYGDLRGYGWTHDSGALDAGPANSSYKTLETMVDKMSAQLELDQNYVQLMFLELQVRLLNHTSYLI